MEKKKEYYSILTIIIAVIVSTLIVSFGIWGNRQHQTTKISSLKKQEARKVYNDSIKASVLHNQDLILESLDVVCLENREIEDNCDSLIKLSNQIIKNQQKGNKQ